MPGDLVAQYLEVLDAVLNSYEEHGEHERLTIWFPEDCRRRIEQLALHYNSQYFPN